MDPTDGKGRGGTAPNVLSFIRARGEQIVRLWIERGRSTESAIEKPEAVFEAGLRQIAGRGREPSFWSGDAYPTVARTPAQLRQDFGLLRRCILDLWAKDVGPVVPVAELHELEQSLEYLCNEISAPRMERPAWMPDSELTRGDVLNIVSHDL